MSESFKERTRQRVRENGKYARYKKGSELCEICGDNVVGEHSSDPRCNETGLGVVLCRKCADALSHVEDEYYVATFEASKTKGEVTIYSQVDVFVVFTPLCRIECEHFSTFFDTHGHGNSQSCINNGGILDDLDSSRFPDGKVPVGCPHFPQELLKKNRRMLDFHQAYGTLCYRYTGRYEGCYQEIQEET